MKKALLILLLQGILLYPLMLLAQDEGVDIEANQKDKNPTEESIWSGITSSAQSITDSTLEKAGQFSEEMNNVYEGAATLSKDSLNGFLEGMDESVILLGKLGYDITDVYINVGLIPDVSFKVARERVLEAEKQNEILETHDIGVVMDYVINKLNKAYDMKVQGYHIKDVKIRLTLSPGATVHFVKNLKE